MICPECQKEGKKSKVYHQGYSATSMGYTPYYDENGKYHNHDPNATEAGYKCSNGHLWSEKIKKKCWCGWEQN